MSPSADQDPGRGRGQQRVHDARDADALERQQRQAGGRDRHAGQRRRAARRRPPGGAPRADRGRGWAAARALDASPSAGRAQPRRPPRARCGARGRAPRWRPRRPRRPRRRPGARRSAGRARPRRRPSPRGAPARAEVEQRLGEGAGVAARHQQAVDAVAHDVAVAGDVGGDDRGAGREGLGEHHAEALAAQRGRAQDVGLAQRRALLGVGDLARARGCRGRPGAWGRPRPASAPTIVSSAGMCSRSASKARSRIGQALALHGLAHEERRAAASAGRPRAVRGRH